MSAEHAIPYRQANAEVFVIVLFFNTMVNLMSGGTNKILFKRSEMYPNLRVSQVRAQHIERESQNLGTEDIPSRNLFSQKIEKDARDDSVGERAADASCDDLNRMRSQKCKGGQDHR